MSSQRRGPRSGARGGGQENGEELNLWQDSVAVLEELQKKEKEAAELVQKIFDEEAKLAEMKRNGKGTYFYMGQWTVLPIVGFRLTLRRAFHSTILRLRVHVSRSNEDCKRRRTSDRSR